MRIIENEGGRNSSEKKIPSQLMILLPFSVVSYVLYIGKPTAYANLALFLIIVYLLIKYRTDIFTKHERLIFEFKANEIYHQFYETQKPDNIELKKVSLIRYGKDYIGFEGDKYYSKEIFFPRKYQDKVNDIVALIIKVNPLVKVDKNV